MSLATPPVDYEYPSCSTIELKSSGSSEQRCRPQSLKDLPPLGRRYEAGTSQPTLDVLRKLAVTLRVSADLLLFDQDERGPDDDLRMQFEAVSQLGDDEKEVVRSVLEGLLLKNQAKRLALLGR